MANKFKNMLIGLFVVVGVGLIIGMILFVEPSIGDGGQQIHVRFSNLQGISDGTRVTMAGKTIGQVSKIQTVPNARENMIGPNGQVYLYLVTISIDSSAVIYKTDEVMVATSGLMGNKYILIVPREIPPNVKPVRVTSKDIINADSSDFLETAMNELSSVTDKVEETLDVVMDWIGKYGDDLGSAIQSFDSTVKGIGVAVRRFNDLDIFADIKSAIQSAERTICHVDDVILYLQESGAFVHVSHMMENLDSITTNIASGKGTIGRLVNDENLYFQINSLFLKANTLLTDINNYGLMFNQNKEWKRKRIQQAELSSAIKDPRDFQAYLDTQVNEMNVIATRLDNASRKLHKNNKRNTLPDREYKKDLKELTEKLEALTDLLRFYNSELAERMNQNS